MEEKFKLSEQHLGQMGNHYPLGEKQRLALLRLMACNESEILAVNGPPGTGKTTLIQNVVANLFVKNALEKKQ